LLRYLDSEEDFISNYSISESTHNLMMITISQQLLWCTTG